VAAPFDADRGRRRDATTLPRRRTFSSRLTPGSRRILVLVVVAVGIAGTLLGAIMGNALRLGPSSVALPQDALTIQAFWYRFPDGDSARDYYSVVVTVVNAAGTPNVSPYAIVVNLTVIGGQPVDYRPVAGDRRLPGEDSLSWGGSPQDLQLDLPAGFVTPHDGVGYQQWTVAGRRGFESQPIFTERADFYAEFILPENASLEAHPDVSLQWFYVNPLQAYPIAMQTKDAYCFYAPSAGTEGTAPYGSCG
jgi:hypothetical protein